MEQVEDAVRCALDPESAPDVKAQATEYCERVKKSPSGWQVCLELFTKVPERRPEARLFALQVIEAAVVDAGVRGGASGAPERLETIRTVLLEFVSTQYAVSRYHAEPAFIKNTLAHTITRLGLAMYPAQWPAFIKDMIALAGIPDTAGPVSDESVAGAAGADINPALADFLIKVLGSLDEEMVNRAVPRGAEETARNSEIKDAMRVADVSRMAHAWYAVLRNLSGSHPDLSQGILRLMGAYVAWIDINLIVNQPFVRMLFELLRAPALRGAACCCLVEIVGKGMRAMDKLYLLRFLGIVDVMKQLDIGDTGFGEQVGRLANVTGIELNAILADKELATAEAQAAAAAMLEELQPLLLTFLSHEQSEVSSSVFLAINDSLAALKKAQREGASLSAFQQEFLAKLLPTLVDKLQYSSDYGWPSPTDAVVGDHDGSLDEDDDEAMFGELRHSLRVFVDAIGQIAPGLYDSVVLAAAQGIFKQCAQFGVSAEQAADEGGKGRGRLGWVRAELGIYLTQAYGDRLSSSKGLRFGGTKHGPPNGARAEAPAASSSSSIDSLRDLLSMMIQSGVISSSHPSIAPMYFENLVRFGGYFEVQREAVAPVLTSFLGPTGIRHPYSTVRPRIWYFLHRFVKQLHCLGLAEYASDFVSAVADMLKIKADTTAAGAAAGLGGGYGLFDSQLYLFEACGMVLAPANLDDSTRMALLQHLFDPLFAGAQQIMNARPADQVLQDPRALLQIHHYLTAIGSVVKGFPDVRVDSKTASASAPHQLSPNTVQVFLKAADMCIAILEALCASQLVREAARFSLSRMLSVLGAEALPYLPRLINSLVSSCAVEELVDLLGLLGQVVFKFKPYVAPTASELLLPVISKVYGFLDQVAANGAAGTDEAVLLQELRKGYLTWIAALFNSDLDGIFLAAQNAPHLVTIFRPIAAQLAVDPASPQAQRLAFSVIFKAVQAWLVDPMGWHTLATLTPSAAAAAASRDPQAPALRQAAAQALGIALDGGDAKAARAQFRQFVMGTVLPACFEAPARPGFQVADAQMSLVVSEIAGVLQMVLLSGAAGIASDDGSAAAAMAAPQLLTVPVGGDLNQNQCASYMSTALLPEMGCPADMAAEFVQALASLDQKQFKKYFVAFLAHSR
ncbi:pre-tRNA nuclear export protein [Coemansia biformis]|uniref:Exportin-T n=1 Tax=Coemansia biformis TaxID=1286918 RepID=A0A9W8D0G5_9FUNG|nr:pre-tRNA nuclear export protein [Coemansia biformis]